MLKKSRCTVPLDSADKDKYLLSCCFPFHFSFKNKKSILFIFLTVPEDILHKILSKLSNSLQHQYKARVFKSLLTFGQKD